MEKIISIDLRADFGFLKKPDTNEPIYLTFNMLHKPALLGILGAILGLGGFSEAKEEELKQPKAKKGGKQKTILPEYFNKLKELKIGIKPLQDENGNFQKTIVKYNNGVGYANLDGNLIVSEQTLIKPAYRCYLLLDTDNELHKQLFEYMKDSKAEYLPYLGKNDFSLWWDNFQEYDFKLFNTTEKSFKLNSIFIKEQTLKDGVQRSKGFKPKATTTSKFMYFENLPTGYNTDLMQYEYEAFAYTDWELQRDYEVNDLYELSNNEIIQLF
ncbi:MAG: type I-B CRISPR-associated protein Cas5 [Cytophagales bacterium]|nr:MAG: type I-B CRISPR-associated protein Cas5 [Cytophagales bacterium]